MSRFSKFAHWGNAGFTLGTITLDADFMLKLAAFLIVTVPLGYVQWVSAVEKWEERKKKRNGRS